MYPRGSYLEENVADVDAGTGVSDEALRSWKTRNFK